MDNPSSSGVNFQKPEDVLHDWFSPSTFGKIEPEPIPFSSDERKRKLAAVFNHINFEEYSAADLKVFDLIDYKPAETGLARVKDMFKRNLEFEASRGVTLCSAVILVFYGGFVKQEETLRRWRTIHATTMFRSHAEGRRRILDYSTVMFMRNGAKAALKGSLPLGLWTGSFFALSAYRDKFSLWHTSVFASLIGFFYHLPRGFPVALYSSVLFGLSSLNQRKDEEIIRICREKGYWFWGKWRAKEEFMKSREYEAINDLETVAED